jgi:hypothetical protein
LTSDFRFIQWEQLQQQKGVTKLFSLFYLETVWRTQWRSVPASCCQLLQVPVTLTLWRVWDSTFVPIWRAVS